MPKGKLYDGATFGPIRKRVRPLIEKHATTTNELDAAALAELAYADLNADPEFANALLRRFTQQVVAREIDAYCDAHPEYVPFGQNAIRRDALSAKARNQPVWATWREKLDDGETVSLMEMGKEELLRAAELRMEGASEQMELAMLWKRLAGRLKGYQSVGQVWSADEIDAARDEVRRSLRQRAG